MNKLPVHIVNDSLAVDFGLVHFVAQAITIQSAGIVNSECKKLTNQFENRENLNIFPSVTKCNNHC
jgi:hypothetical protein